MWHPSFLLVVSYLAQWSPIAAVDTSKSSFSSTTDDAQKGFYFVHKSIIIPHDSKKFRGGEDAAATSDRFLVVADGVGGWARHNVNPGLYSRMLTSTVLELGHRNMSLPLQDVVHQANWLAAKEHLGSATCTTLKLVAPNQITTLNVGDSGYSIHRRNAKSHQFEVVFASQPGQKSFNFPHQLGGKHGDSVRDVATEFNHTLEPDDIIVVFSDGVSDNMFPTDFHACLDMASSSSSSSSSSSENDGYELKSFSLAADCISRVAYFRGKDTKFDSPFAQGARKAGWMRQAGGKHDDITVVVAQIRTGDVPVPLEDPFRKESIYLYTGPVGAVEELPTLEKLLLQDPVGIADEL